jgi:hypothetical protein
LNYLGFDVVVDISEDIVGAFADEQLAHFVVADFHCDFEG